MSSPRLVFLAAALLLPAISLLRAEDDAAIEPHAPATVQQMADIAGNFELAHHAADEGNIDLAEKFYAKLLAVDAPDEAKKKALFDMFEIYRSKGFYSKAVAVGERIHQLFPTDRSTPDLLLKLGRLYRQTGAYQLAIARFYNVLNAALRVDQSDFKQYQDFSKQAQFEIADTFMTSGDFQQAGRTYNMLDRLDLTPDEKSHAEFEAVYCGFLVGDYSNTVKEANRFLETYGQSQYAPQCHYIISMALRSLGHPQEATDETLVLLRMEKQVEKSDAATWSYWKKKTGNQLANGFYQDGDFLHALTLYQAMAKLSDDPDWQWPVLYQAGLCFERLGLPDRAAEAYHYILDESKKAQTAGKSLDQDLTELTHMADWRSQHLEWQEGTEAQLNDLLGPRAPADDDTPIPALEPKVTQTP
jgi:tetratricopeptide (TPR) repeat protein